MKIKAYCQIRITVQEWGNYNKELSFYEQLELPDKVYVIKGLAVRLNIATEKILPCEST